MNKPYPLTAAVAAALLLSGCWYYSFSGSTLPPHIDSVAVPLFTDTSAEFGIDQQLTDKVIEVISTDNTLRIEGAGRAASIIKGSITRITDRPDTYDQAENASAFRVTITIHVLYEDVKKNITLWEEDFTQWGRYDNASISRESGISEAVEKLAEEILNKTVSGW
ncbi:hypothetical protein JXO52_12440 [bacterium]|nr:hypothetical protein [bacterium]